MKVISANVLATKLATSAGSKPFATIAARSATGIPSIHSMQRTRDEERSGAGLGTRTRAHPGASAASAGEDERRSRQPLRPRALLTPERAESRFRWHRSALRASERKSSSRGRFASISSTSHDRSKPSKRTLAAATSAATVATSALQASRRPRCWTLTARTLPSLATALWTCASEAEATGTRSNDAKSVSGRSPRSSAIVLATPSKSETGQVLSIVAFISPTWLLRQEEEEEEEEEEAEEGRRRRRRRRRQRRGGGGGRGGGESIRW